MKYNKDVTFLDLEESVKKYIKSDDDLLLIKKAYDFAERLHEGQKRRTGEDYISHPLHVALILTEIVADSETICAALLHDVLEDCDISKDELTLEFGSVIANLVDGVTKINSINVSTENDYLINYYKKIIVGMSEDVRVIIIKLADRLHNMRTLYAIPIDRQKLKAKETLEILAPIAHRLGMHKIKSELEDLSLRYMKPDVYYDIVERLNNTKVERDSYVANMIKEVSDLLNDNGIKHEIKGRSKSIYSIYKKLDKGKSFSSIYDLLALRILVNKEQECYLALGLIHSKYKPMAKRFKDYIAMPKTNLYQSLHTTIFGLDGHLFEIQIRTYDMDEYAENGIASHWAYKEGKNAALEMQNVTEKKLQFYKSIIELNEDKMSPADFVNSVKDEVLNNNIYVYTPKGDVMELLNGSTPIDFAYKVHTRVGDTMTGAIVNDVMVPLTYELKNGDIVKIVTNKNSLGPSYEWLSIAKTTQAKNKIKNFFNKTNREEYITIGKDSLEKELRRNKLSIADFMKNDVVEILTENKFDSIDDLYLNIGNGKISCKGLFKNESSLKDEVDSKKPLKVVNVDSDIIVGDVSDIQTRIANCCLPVPGDNIVGYITRGNGISIHKMSCPNIDHEDDRIIDVKWNSNIKNKYESDLVIYTNTKDNILFDLVQTASNVGVSVENITTIGKERQVIYGVTAIVSNVDELEKLILAYENLASIVLVERINK